MKKLLMTAALAALMFLAACSGPGEGKTGGTKVRESPDKYTWYVRDYKGRNAASFKFSGGYGYRFDKYGDGKIKLAFVTDDGKYVDASDDEALKQYCVTGQDPAPDTEIKFTYAADENGNEYLKDGEFALESQSIEEVTLYIARINGSGE